jgi:mannose-6-phosphate isomerase-like protein (cupin superfamily)
MSDLGRRDFLQALAAIGIVTATSAEGQTNAPTAGGGSLGKTRVFAPEFKKQPNGSDRWGALDGTLATGEAVSMHVSIVPAGTPGAAPHKIMHSELVVLAEGTLELWADGEVSRATAGSVIYVAYGTTHAVKNVGDGPAKYFVWQMGGDTK